MSIWRYMHNRPGQPSAGPAGPGRVQGVYAGKKIKDLQQEKRSAMIIFVQILPIFGYFGVLIVLVEFSRICRFFGGSTSSGFGQACISCDKHSTVHLLSPQGPLTNAQRQPEWAHAEPVQHVWVSKMANQPKVACFRFLVPSSLAPPWDHSLKLGFRSGGSQPVSIVQRYGSGMSEAPPVLPRHDRQYQGKPYRRCRERGL